MISGGIQDNQFPQICLISTISKTVSFALDNRGHKTRHLSPLHHYQLQYQDI